MPRRNRRLIGQTKQHNADWPKARVLQLHRELMWRMKKLWRTRDAVAARRAAGQTSEDVRP